MLRWNDYTRGFAALDELRRQMNAYFEELDRPRSPMSELPGHTWPRTNLFDNGSELVLYAAIPGILEKDIELTLTGDTLALSGKRNNPAPEGYSIHRQERGSIRFARSFTLPVKVDPEKVAARVRDGMLVVTMAKAAEAKPRQITVQAS